MVIPREVIDGGALVLVSFVIIWAIRYLMSRNPVDLQQGQNLQLGLTTLSEVTKVFQEISTAFRELKEVLTIYVESRKLRDNTEDTEHRKLYSDVSIIKDVVLSIKRTLDDKTVEEIEPEID